MQIAFASLVGIERMPFTELVPRAAALGLTAIEVNVGPTFPRLGGAAYNGHLDLERIIREGPEETAALLAAHGAEIVSLAPMLNLLAPDAELRAMRIAVIHQTIDAAVVLGLNTVVTYGGSAYGAWFWGLPAVGLNHPSNKLADNLAQFREVYTPLAAYAEERGVRIAFETAGRGGGEGNLAHSPALWEMLFDAVPSPALGLSFDPSHLIWLQVPDIPGVIRTFGPRIYHFDGKDTEILPDVLARQGIYGNSWWRYRLPGQGAVPWAAALSALGDIGYDGPVAIENEDPRSLGLAGVAWSANYLRGLMLP